MGDTYDEDILLWSERQAELLRRHAGSARENDAIDWPHIIEEIEDAGLSSLRVCRSSLLQALLHILRADAWPSSRDVPLWRAEVRRLRGDAADAYTNSMRQRIDLDHIYRRAIRAMPDTMDGVPPLPVPEMCPVTLDELLLEG
jgi:hypothetical protein